MPATVVLPALDRFSDEYAPAERLARLDPKADPEATGPHSRTVRGIICGGCCGWPEPPTSEEVHEAIRAETGAARGEMIVKQPVESQEHGLVRADAQAGSR